MSETAQSADSTSVAPAAAPAAAPADSVTVMVDGKTETFTAAAAGRTTEQKTALAQHIWVTWRNKALAGLSADTFNRLNAAGADLVAAIVAEL